LLGEVHVRICVRERMYVRRVAKPHLLQPPTSFNT